MEVELLKTIREKASKLNKTIILPESHDERVLKAAEIIVKAKIANVVTLGNPDQVHAKAKELGVKLDNVKVLDYTKSENFEKYSEEYCELRKHRGMTIDKARETLKRDLFYAAMMVRNNEVSGSVAGSTASTADVMKAGIQCIGMPKGNSVVSSFFLLIFPDKAYSFGDCAVVPNPDEKQLADIAIATADNYKKLIGIDPVVAMLSFSTKGSAKHELLDKVIAATKIAQEKRPDLLLDGEMQFDAAVIGEVGEKKAPGSKVAGKANVLIFPDLNAGNIAYKIAQRWGKAEAVGPMVQGLQKPFFDLSRGASVDDIVNTSAICMLMS